MTEVDGVSRSPDEDRPPTMDEVARRVAPWVRRMMDEHRAATETEEA